MALVLADRVRETSTTVSTGTLTLAGAVANFQSFAAIGNTNTTYYTIVNRSASEWEIGIGTYTASGTTLSRDTVLSSSNSGSLVNFSAGTKDVWGDYPAGKAVTTDTLAYPPAIGGTTAAAGTFTTLVGRTNPRVSSAATATSLTPSIATTDVYAYTALASALSINAPIGTPLDGNKLIFRLLDNGTARALTWDAIYTVIGTTLPTTTVINKTTYVGCIYNANNTRWDVIAVTTQA